MSTQKKNTLQKLIKIFLDLTFGLLVLVIAVLVIWMALSPFLAQRLDVLGTVSIPVRVGSGDLPSLEVTFLHSSPRLLQGAVLEEARGTLRVETDSPLLIALANGAKLVTAVGLAYIINLLRRMLRNVMQGQPFSSQNSRLIRRLGYAVLLVGLGSASADGMAAQEILHMLPGTSPALQAGSTIEPGLAILTSVFIFLLAQIWSYGLELEEERELTV
jgi:hypothetical protein